MLLRALTSIELFLNAEFYASHPLLQNFLATENTSSLLGSFFQVDHSFNDSNLFQRNLTAHVDNVKIEALENCKNGRWSPFMSVLALSSVLGLEIHSFYPKAGAGQPDNCAYKVLNSIVKPREETNGAKAPVRLLWTRLHSQKNPCSKSFIPNHVVPLFLVKKPSFMLKKAICASKQYCLPSTSGRQAKISFPAKAKDEEEIPCKRIRLDPASEENIQQYSEPSFTILSSNECVSDCHLLPSSPQYDIGKFYKNVEELSDYQIYDILKNIWKPNQDHIFPVHNYYGRSRRFNYSWLQKFPWLSYSCLLDGTFCLPCVFFGRRIGLNSAKLEKLMKSAFCDWSCASRRFNDHQMKSEIHKTALLTMQSFLAVMENEIQPINHIQNKLLQDNIAKNRKKLASIVETIILHGRRNFALRGHRDDSKYYDTADCGNFQAMLNFRIDSGDTVLKEHFEKAPKNATYRSKTVQNEIISCCADVINESIVREIREAKFYSILADEVRDCSNKEQMPLIIRFVDQKGEIQERFIKFIHCDTGLSGKALMEKVVHCITQELKLEMKNCRGQCYDGAGNMAGKFSGLSSRILSHNPLALYTHCSSHRLNLCVAASCKIQNVRNMMDSVTKISNFFNSSPKRHQLLERMVKKYIPGCKRTKLLDVCRTRWVLRIDGLERFMEMYTAITEAMFEIRDNLDGNWDNSAADAYALSSLLTSFDFISTLVVVRMCLGYIRSATIQLQGAHIDIIRGLQEISMMKTSLQNTRNSIDEYHDAWFQEAVNISNKVGATISFPRRCERQVYRGNIPADDVSTYIKRNLSVPFLDHLLQELSTRFSETNCNAYKALSVVPSVMMREYPKEEVFQKTTIPKEFSAAKTFECKQQTTRLQEENQANTSKKRTGVKVQRLDKSWKIDLVAFCEQYEQDMPSINNISHEVDNWESFWLNFPKDKLPCGLSDTIKLTNPVTFPNITAVLRILATLPITSCSCERSASAIRLLKSYLRSTMSQERLNGLASLFTHKDIDVPVHKVIDLFSKKSRKITLANILDSDQQLEENDEVLQSEIY